MTERVSTQDPAFKKLVTVLGPVRAEEVVSEILGRLGLPRLATPDDRFRFGCELIARGGVLEAIGRSIKIQAILHGGTG